MSQHRSENAFANEQYQKLQSVFSNPTLLEKIEQLNNKLLMPELDPVEAKITMDALARAIVLEVASEDKDFAMILRQYIFKFFEQTDEDEGNESATSSLNSSLDTPFNADHLLMDDYLLGAGEAYV